MKMRDFPTITDPTYKDIKDLNAFDHFWLDKMRDKRDLILVYFKVANIVIHFLNK